MSLQAVLSSLLVPPSSVGCILGKMHPVHTEEGKEQLRESSEHFQQHSGSTGRALISFLHSNASFLLISHQQNIDPTQLFLEFRSYFSSHGLPWQNPLILSMSNLSRAGRAQNPKATADVPGEPGHSRDISPLMSLTQRSSY